MSRTTQLPDSAWDPHDFRNQVQECIDAFIDDQSTRLAPLGADAERLLTQARHSLSGGKRFRAAFCYWGHRAVEPGDTHHQALIRACAALEVLHASALVHDDFMDASDTRRGRPATHLVFEEQHRRLGWKGSPSQYGAAGAILLGDLLLSWADELLRRSDFPSPHVTAAMNLYDLCRSEVIVGQFLDVSVQARGAADVETAMTVLRYKSAKYSIERPLHIGAALAGADEATIQDLTAFGLPLGEAFQLRDDLLGVFGDPEMTGKPAGDDLVEGKRTVLVALALDAATPEDAATLDAALGTPLNAAQVAHLRSIIDASGAHRQVEDAIEMLFDQALQALGRANIDETARASLRELATAVTDRAH